MSSRLRLCLALDLFSWAPGIEYPDLDYRKGGRLIAYLKPTKSGRWVCVCAFEHPRLEEDTDPNTRPWREALEWLALQTTAC